MRGNFDMRIWNLPESARGLPAKLLELQTGKTQDEFLEGGLETANTIVGIVNDYLDGKALMAYQDIPADTSEGKEKVTFKMVAL